MTSSNYRASHDAGGAPRRPPQLPHPLRSGQLPPVGALGFWSITMYDQTFYLVDNPIDRYSVGDRTHILTKLRCTSRVQVATRMAVHRGDNDSPR